MFVPSKIFLTKGVGIHRDRLTSFELALRKADVAAMNLVTVSSILPPRCKIVSKSQGVKELKQGQIVFCVLARAETNEPNRLISAAVGVAVPKDKEVHGYLSEHHSCGEIGKRSQDYAEDLAATMLATILGVKFDIDTAWDDRKKIYKASRHIFRATSICQSAEGNKNGLWTTVVALAVLLP